MASDLVLQERLSDVILKLRQSEQHSWRLPAHSLLLVSKSSVFQEMLDEHEDKENSRTLPMVGVRPETALAVLKYIYENKFPSVVTADLLIAAKKYDLEPLRDNLEERLMDDLNIPQVCQILEELTLRNPVDWECTVKTACFNMLEMHALIVFGSDIIMSLGRNVLCRLLASDKLNVPDEAYIFWGLWRWGRRQSSMNDRSLRNEDVAAYIDDLIVCIRRSSVRNKAGIPQVAFQRFNECKCRRTRYSCPPDILKFSIPIRPCPTWEDIVAPKMTESEESQCCIQLSVEDDVMLVGLSLEMLAHDRSESVLRVLQESDRREILRQKVGWCVSSERRFSARADPERRVESEITLHTPLFLAPGNIYSIQLAGNFSSCHFIWGSFRKRRMKIGNTFVNFHGEGATTIREINVIPDVSVSWGPRYIGV